MCYMVHRRYLEGRSSRRRGERKNLVGSENTFCEIEKNVYVDYQRLGREFICTVYLGCNVKCPLLLTGLPCVSPNEGTLILAVYNRCT